MPMDSGCLAPSSKARQWLSVVMSGVAVFTMGGLCFGFDSIYPILYSGGAFLDYCPAEQAEQCAARPIETRQTKCCDDQLSAFVKLTSVSLFGADGVAVVYGELIDRAGPRWCMSIALVLAWLGLGLVSFNASLGAAQRDWMWNVAFPLIGNAGPGIFMSVLSFGEVYPHLGPTITPLAASMFDGSAFVFLLWKVLFQALHLPLSLIASFWLVLAVCLGCFTWSLLLSRSQTERMRAEHAQQAEHEKSAELQSAVETAGNTDTLAEAPHVPLWYSEGDSLIRLFSRTDTVLLLLFMCIANLNQSFYIETFADQARETLPLEQAEEIVEVFDIIFPILSIATTPLAIFLVTRYNHREHIYMGVVCGLSCLFGVTQAFPSRAAQYMAALFFGPARTLQWACYFHYLASPAHYPSSSMGRMVGYANLIVALFGDLPPYALNAYVQYASYPTGQGDRYVLTHATLVVVVIVLSVVFPLHLRNAGIGRADRGGRVSRRSTGSDGGFQIQKRSDSGDFPGPVTYDSDGHALAVAVTKVIPALGGDRLQSQRLLGTESDGSDDGRRGNTRLP